MKFVLEFHVNLQFKFFGLEIWGEQSYLPY